MGPESSSEYFDVAGTIESVNTTRYLNIGSDSTSYKTVTFSNASTTTGWGLEGDTIITTTASTWGRREFCFSSALPWLTAAADQSPPELNFLACQLDDTYWQVYLQTGSDVPSGPTCSNYQTLHLPCLC